MSEDNDPKATHENLDEWWATWADDEFTMEGEVIRSLIRRVRELEATCTQHGIVLDG